MIFLVDGLKLMVVGMGMVFSFLVVMIFWILLSAKVSAKFTYLLPDDVKSAPRRKKPATPKPAGGSSDQSTLAAVISAAVQAYRADHK